MVSGANNFKTILAVDDSAIVQQSIKRSLENAYRVLVTSNAVDALSLIYHEPISAVLLDVTMPGVDGLELCRTVRSLPQFQHLPIIMLTARDSAFDKVQGRLAGATEYLTKPFEAATLQEVLERLIDKKPSSSAS
ncbi:response regulator [Desertifilum sp. FACHB-1129]|uniref:Regulator n=3 Tax=Cyanophyceae TaxID=3028117 RepID=A0A1E5QJM5_9CYAN|nr:MULTISPECIES: response regulator [Cyanophyceae]MCD8486892.1 response regulator [Desertifilum sp.]MDA0210953.1 response regulator [Cyanobacteria bacterium FC1]MDK3159040.1 response regulator [Kamptonema cortianum]MBD2313444.1 response regulator [Desertifilum sp. FACHB-1129]MBD2322314.1 response regulator [Desertifilum sp. FACHB-866]